MPAPLPKDGLTLVIKSSSTNTEILSVFSRKIYTKSAPKFKPKLITSSNNFLFESSKFISLARYSVDTIFLLIFLKY